MVRRGSLIENNLTSSDYVAWKQRHVALPWRRHNNDRTVFTDVSVVLDPPTRVLVGGPTLHFHL